MHINLSGRVAVVTGSTAGIGLAIAKGLAGTGAAVVVNGRSEQRVQEAVGAVAEAVPGAEVRGRPADVGTAEGCAALVAAEPRADVLVNNAGVFGPKDFFDVPDAEWTRFMEVNIMAGVRLSRAYLPGMLERDWGRVVFISSESGLNIPVEMIHYGVTKTAVLSLSRGLAKRAAGTGVTVNAVLPGPTLSEGIAEMLRDSRKEGQSLEDAAAEFVMANRPSSILRRAASVEEVANMVVYTASPQASATTGAALRVDGGVVDSIA